MKNQVENYIISIQMYGYKVIKTSNKINYGLEELNNILKNNTTAFAGQSGVRKVNTNK